jgi:hypothetical protein
LNSEIQLAAQPQLETSVNVIILKRSFVTAKKTHKARPVAGDYLDASSQA